MRRAMAAGLILASSVLVWGCGNKAGDDAGKTTAPSAAPATPAKAQVSATPTAVAGEVLPPGTLAAGRTPAPTLEEWNTLKKEVTVKGSSALRCETKIIREYLRVSCKDEVPEGTPKGIKVLKGGREAMVFAHGGVMSLILPYV